MSEYDKLKGEFDQKVKELQDRCEHKEFAWQEERPLFAHSNRWQIRICLNCNRPLERKYPSKSPKELEEDRKRFEKEMEWIKHSGAMVEESSGEEI